MKLGIQDGFSVGELLNSQYTFGWCLMFMMVPFFKLKGLTIKACGSALLVGLSISITSIFYGIAVKELPASLAIVLLFQFIWIGEVIEAVIQRAWPERRRIVSIIILLVGTALAAGLFQGRYENEITMIGIVCGLISACSFAVYIQLSNKVLMDIPSIKRSFYITMSIMVIMLIVYSPTFLFNGAIPAGLWKYGLLLGVFGTLIPITFFAIGIPKVGSGMGTILGAAELPAAVVAAQTFLKEDVVLLQWIGILFILIGIIIPLIRRKLA